MKQAGRESFDLFILDWQVPDVSGADVLKWLRANVSRSVPVLFVTCATPSRKSCSPRAGRRRLLVKPVRQQELLARDARSSAPRVPREEQKQLSFPPVSRSTSSAARSRRKHEGRPHAQGVRADRQLFRNLAG